MTISKALRYTEQVILDLKFTMATAKRLIAKMTCVKKRYRFYIIFANFVTCEKNPDIGYSFCEHINPMVSIFLKENNCHFNFDMNVVQY